MANNNLTADQISKATGSTKQIAVIWTPFLNDAMCDFDINTPMRQAAFLAQIGYESGGLKNLVENLNYSANGLISTFGKKFTPELAAQYAKQPEKIANFVYAFKNGNGPESSGDGWKYRGRCPIQLTGLLNYANARDRLKKIHGTDTPDFVANPDAILDPQWSSACSAMYFATSGCNALADSGNFNAITRAINGPAMLGKDARLTLWALAKNALGVKNG